MKIFTEISGVQPEFDIEVVGYGVRISFFYGLHGYDDEELGYVVYEGESFLNLGSYSDSAFATSGDDRPLIMEITTAALTPGQGYNGSYSLSDWNDGTTLEFDFRVVVAGRNFPNIISKTDNNDILIGTRGINTLSAGSGNNFLFGRDGNDRFLGGSGTDLFDGGSGFDTVSYHQASAAITLDLSRPENNTGDAVGDRFVSIETIEGTKFDDYMVGHATLGNDFRGGDGDDHLVGGNGSDMLHGDSGNDLLEGGNGDDRLFGGTGNDTLIGGNGDDHLHGNTGGDIMIGGRGNDRYTVDDKGDIVDETGGNGIDTVFSYISFALDGPQVRGTVENLTLLGSEDSSGRGTNGVNEIVGDAGNNTLLGLGGNDTLRGGYGNDRLVGGSGADKLFGGSGADTFVYTKISDSTRDSTGRDIIDVISRNQGDKIDLSAIDANTTRGGNQAFTFIGAAEFSKTAGELRFNHADGQTYVRGDVDGDGVTDFNIQINRVFTFIATDFVL